MATNQHTRKMFDSLSTSIDLQDPNGLEMSAAFDKYLERVIKPLYADGAKVRRMDAINHAAGTRNVNWFFESGNAKIAEAVRASAANFVQGWESKRGESGPMSLGSVTQREFGETSTRILNTRTRAAVARMLIESGGRIETDKDTGVSTFSAPIDAVTSDGKNLLRSVRGKIREGDRAFLEGRVALSALAEGASPATQEERALAMSNAGYKRLLAKHKAMSPEQEQTEFRLNLEKRWRRAQYQADFEKNNPDHPMVAAKRAKAVTAKKAKNRRNAVAAKSAIFRAIALTTAAIMMAVNVLNKILNGVVNMADTVRKRQTEGAMFNLTSSEMAKFNRVENAMWGFEKGTFSNIFGNLMNLSDPTTGSFEKLLEGGAKLFQRDTPDMLALLKNIHPDQLMFKLTADLLNITAQGRGGVISRDTVSEAHSVNLKMLSDLFGDKFAEYYARMYEIFGEVRIGGKTFTADEVKEKTFGVSEKAPIIKPSTNAIAASEQGVKALAELKAFWESLKETFFTHILAHLSELVAVVRNMARQLFGKAHPEFAASEENTARSQAMRDTIMLEADMKAGEARLEPYKAKSKYKDADTFTYAKAVLDIAKTGDVVKAQQDLGLNYDQFLEMLTKNSFLLQTAMKLQERLEGNNVTIGGTEHSHLHIGGMSAEERAYSAEGIVATFLYKSRTSADKAVREASQKRYAYAEAVPIYNQGYQDKIASERRGALAAANAVYSNEGRAAIPHGTIRVESRLSDVLPKVIEAVGSHGYILGAVPELKEAGVSREDLLDVAGYLKYLSGQKTDKKLQILYKEMASDAEAAAKHINAYGNSHEDNEKAAAVIGAAGKDAAAASHTSAINKDVGEKLTGIGLVREQVSAALSTAQGFVYTLEGSNKELHYNIVVKIQEDGKEDREVRITGAVPHSGAIPGWYKFDAHGNGIDIMEGIRGAYLPQK